MNVGREELLEITRTVFETTLGLAPAPASDAPMETSEFVVCSISISGAWEGTISISLPEQLARTITASMLACGAHETTRSDMADAVGEVVNQLGGSVKALLPAPSTLSLPTLLAEPTAEPESVLTFVCGDQTFSVVVHPNASPKREEP